MFDPTLRVKEIFVPPATAARIKSTKNFPKSKRKQNDVPYNQEQNYPEFHDVTEIQKALSVQNNVTMKAMASANEQKLKNL